MGLPASGASPSFLPCRQAGFRPLSRPLVFTYGKVKALYFQVQEILHYFWNTTKNLKFQYSAFQDVTQPIQGAIQDTR